MMVVDVNFFFVVLETKIVQFRLNKFVHLAMSMKCCLRLFNLRLFKMSSSDTTGHPFFKKFSYLKKELKKRIITRNHLPSLDVSLIHVAISSTAISLSTCFGLINFSTGDLSNIIFRIFFASAMKRLFRN